MPKNKNKSILASEEMKIEKRGKGYCCNMQNNNIASTTTITHNLMWFGKLYAYVYRQRQQKFTINNKDYNHTHKVSLTVTKTNPNP